MVHEIRGDVTLDAIVDSIRDLDLSHSTVGVEVDGHQTLFMPTSVYDGLRQRHPHMRIVSCFPAIMTIRAVKSPLEIECLREACRITTAASETRPNSINSQPRNEQQLCNPKINS